MRIVADDRASCGRSRRPRRVGLVPTMGAFHDGHLSLFRAARAECDTVVVQPLRQPGAVRRRARTSPRYPRDEERDAAPRRGGRRRRPLRAVGRRDVSAGLRDLGRRRATRAAEGAARPGHFRGVATVCLKLFNIVRPRRRLLRPEGRAAGRASSGGWSATSTCELELRVLPTVRDADGLALSSRNAYLSAPDERERALALPRALEAARPRTRRIGPGRSGARRAQRARAGLRRGRRPRRRHASSPPPPASAPPA